MTIFKCKICGGALEVDSAHSVATCQYCGMKQTLPRLDDERRANLYDRANHFRRNNDFDKAMSIYEQILNEDATDAEAYWSIVLCCYGIEYVEDPATHRRVPTINRAQFTSIFDDENYKSAISNADEHQREIYEAEANTINEIQKSILAISQKEEPFDIFICYKETDNNGRRTQDSVLAQDLYYQLEKEGFKVFFSRITLEEKLGTAYEPYIFAALNSAKVMVVLGTRPEYFNAVWVKNEWSRYLALIRNGAKKALIPAYRDMDPYDLPEEFSHLQAQDMSKLGFMQDLVRGIEKIISVKNAKSKQGLGEEATDAKTAPLLKRVFMFLEDGEFDRADEFCEQILNRDPENAYAYLGKLMAELQIKRQADLANCTEPFDTNKNYQKTIRFADKSLAAELNDYLATVKERVQKQIEANRKRKEKERIEQERAAQEEEKRLAKAAQATKKKVLIILGILFVLAALAGLIVNIVKYEWEDGIQYVKKDDGYYVNATRLASGTVEIPGEVNGVAVIGIKESAFQNNTSLTAVVIPSSVIEIEEGAFNGCSSLESITLPFVGGEVNARQEKTLFGFIFGRADYEGSDLVVQSWGAVPNRKYYVPTSLKNVTITGGKIYGRSFQNCLRLENIVLGDNVEIVGASAFASCSALKNITISSSVKEIGTNAFYGSDSLSNVYISDLAAWCSIDFSDFSANPLSIADKLYINGKEFNGNLTIPNTIEKISDYAFYHCRQLTSLIVPLGVTSIGRRAFECCENLERVEIYPYVTEIEDAAFRYCTKLGEVNFVGDSKLNSIGQEVFLECTALESITIPTSVRAIGTGAFYGCENLETAIFEYRSYWKAYSDDGSEVSLALTNTLAAANYLRTTYAQYTWKRTY